MKKFTKNDLQTGHIIVTKDKGNAILIGDVFKRSSRLTDPNAMTDIYNYDEDLKHTSKDFEEFNIEKVYKIICCERKSLSEIIDHLPEKYVELVWERPREIDWSKVPKFTKVQVRDSNDEKWKNRYFIEYKEKTTYPYLITSRDNFTYEYGNTGYKQIRIYDESDIKEEWYK